MRASVSWLAVGSGTANSDFVCARSVFYSVCLHHEDSGACVSDGVGGARERGGGGGGRWGRR